MIGFVHNLETQHIIYKVNMGRIFFNILKFQHILVNKMNIIIHMNVQNSQKYLILLIQ